MRVRTVLHNGFDVRCCSLATESARSQHAVTGNDIWIGTGRSGSSDQSRLGVVCFVADAASVGAGAGSIRHGASCDLHSDFTQTLSRVWFFQRAQSPPASDPENAADVLKMTQESPHRGAVSPARLHHSIQLEAKSPRSVDFLRKRRARSLFMTHTSVEENIVSSWGSSTCSAI